ncbi:MAG: hypothetical protein E7563_01705 [Ruminococcaceae bacterium]|nr:hypothetical protein [Oscillospiraceae bacterium]
MGSIYSGFGESKKYLGHCDDGIIYKGVGNSNPIGRYNNGSVYNQFKEIVGFYGGGSIYNSFREHIASYDDGIVYSKYLNYLTGQKQVGTYIGSYDGESAEAAALVLLFLGGDSINQETESENFQQERTTSESSESSSDTGCLGSIFSIIGFLLMGAIKLIFYFYKFIFLYLFFTIFATVTIFYFIILILSAVTGILPGIALGLGVFGTVLVASSLPYWVILFTQKFKRKMKWKDTFKYYGKWFIKGPLAYKDIIELKNSPVD